MIYLDSHVHIYDTYDIDRLFEALVSRRAAAGATIAMVLVERQGQQRFSAWAAAAGSERARETRLGGRWQPARTPDPLTVVMSDGHREVTVFAGRQVAARERVEALGLLTATAPEDGLPLAATLDGLRQAGALPVLAWGVGKWLFGRARLVRRTLARATPATLLVGDSALRPVGWLTPRPMAAARRRGFRVLCGSDPLPRPHEERRAGQYATLIMGDLDPAAPAASLRRLLEDPAVTLRPAGRRSSLRTFLRRLR